MRRCLIRTLTTNTTKRWGLPKVPTFANKNFTLPPLLLSTNEKLILHEVNSHPMDARIAYDPVSQTYSVDGTPVHHVIDQMLEQFFEAFDADFVIDKMITGKNWPRDNYMNAKTGEPLTDHEIKQKWDRTRVYSKNRELWMHYNFERYVNSLEPSACEENESFKQFYKEMITDQDIQPYRSTWKIAAPDLQMAGSIDFVGRLADGTFAIMDWKRSKRIDFENSFRKASYPLDVHDGCDGTKYFMKMNIAKHILERTYQVVVSHMGIVNFHNDAQYVVTEVPTMADEVESVIREVQRRRDEEQAFLNASVTPYKPSPPDPTAAGARVGEGVFKPPVPHYSDIPF